MFVDGKREDRDPSMIIFASNTDKEKSLRLFDEAQHPLLLYVSNYPPEFVNCEK
jgi:hypothetical protein